MRIYELNWPDGEDFQYDLFPFLQVIDPKGRPVDAWSWVRTQNTLIIVHEAQTPYKCDKLWNEFLKFVSDGMSFGPKVILFSSYVSSYGSPSDIPVPHYPDPCVGGPIMLTTRQRVSIQPLYENNQKVGLYFTYREFKDVVNRVCEYHRANGKPIFPSPELLSYMWEISCGQPGATRAILDALVNSEVSFASLIMLSAFSVR